MNLDELRKFLTNYFKSNLVSLLIYELIENKTVLTNNGFHIEPWDVFYTKQI